MLYSNSYILLGTSGMRKQERKLQLQLCVLRPEEGTGILRLVILGICNRATSTGYIHLAI